MGERRRKIKVDKLKPIRQTKTVRVERINQTRRVNIIQRHQPNGRQDIVIVKPNDSDRERKIRIAKPTAPRVPQVPPGKTVMRVKGGRNPGYDRKINDLKDVGRGRILVMVACGPSINEIDIKKFDKVKNLDIMVINKPILEINPKYWAFCDHSQYHRNKDVWYSYGELTITSNNVRATKPNQVTIHAHQGKGIKRNLTEGYIIGRSSVYANMQTAIWMNYDKVYIFGVDMCEVDGKLHHYGVNPDVPEERRKERFQFEASHYDRMVQVLPDEIKEKIFFCSRYNPYKFVERFNKLDHVLALDIILKEAESISNE